VSNKKIKTAAPELLVGGPATNAAVAFSKVNGGAYLATAVGEHPFRNFCAEDFNLTHISHFDISENHNTKPVLASVVTSVNSGERNIFTHNPEEIIPLYSPEELFENTKPEIILIDSFYPEFSIDCGRLAKDRGIPVVLDGGSWKPQYEALLDFADVIICSEDFFPPGCSQTNQTMEILRFKNVKHIAISRGNKSILYFSGTEQGEIPVCKTEVKDTLGAGDFLHGAFCFYYLNTKNFKTALSKASELASFTCRFKGTRKWLKELN
jgi:sugar/nucleoside kinase (ribokinase family)